jgi:hypothetical protein
MFPGPDIESLDRDRLRVLTRYIYIYIGLRRCDEGHEAGPFQVPIGQIRYMKIKEIGEAENAATVGIFIWESYQ